MHHIRNHPEQRLRSYVEDGRIKSHLTDKFPECVSFEELGKRKMKKTLAVMRRTGKYPGSKYKGKVIKQISTEMNRDKTLLYCDS